ncbi:MAG: EAL domain-containing protein, partial [Thiohalobacterales bacterium]|nr:EAL domain-containing protein [Thiohalobacterales bacterium]
TAYVTTIGNAESSLRLIAQEIADDTSALLLQIDQGLIALSGLSYACTESDIRAMNNMAYDIPGISELSLIRPDRKLVCTSWGKVDPPIDPELPPPAAGFRLVGPVEIRLMDRYGLVAIRQREDGSEVGALIHPNVLIGHLGADLGEHGFAVLLHREDSNIFAWAGNVPEMEVVESEAEAGGGSTQLRARFSDGVERTLFTVELDGFPGIYSVTAVSDSWILRDWVRLALILGSVGLIASVVLVMLVISVLMRRLSLQGELESSLQKDEFEINYLPVISLGNGRCVGGEALISWRQPGGRRVRPDLFIPLAEDTGLIEPMTEWLMKKLLEETGELLQRDRSLHIAINLSPSHFESDRILQSSSSIFGNSGILPEQIIYEITERSVIEDGSKARHVMESLSKRNSGIALDDFGTGYSSLSYIESFPLDYIKIDKRFVEAIGSDAPTAGLIDAIIDMTGRLGLQTIAEGVETREQQDYLMSRGVDFAQGWYYSKAVPIGEFRQFVSRRNAE